MTLRQAFALLALLVPLGAQPLLAAQDEPAITERLVQRLHQRLDLSDEQLAELRPMLEHEGRAVRALREKYKEQGAAGVAPMMRQNRLAMEARLREVLSEKQVREYVAYRDQRGRRIAEQVREHLIAASERRLGLSAEQVAQLRPIVRESFDKRRQLRAGRKVS